MKRRAFTLVELLVSTAIIALLMVVLVGMTGQASKTWQYTNSKVEQFREARSAFGTVTRRMSQATLNTYWDYVDADKNGVPEKYGRQSELRFITGPMEEIAGISASKHPTHGVFCQAPLGFADSPATAGGNDYRSLHNLLNTWGCFVEFGDDQDFRPPFLTKEVAPLRYRYRLLEMLRPADELQIYNPDAQDPAWRGWFTGALTGTSRPVRVLSENIVALVLLPKLSKTERDQRLGLGKPMLAPDYVYDSTQTNSSDPEVNPKNQLPPIMQVTMVAIDEISASRLADRSGTSAPDLIPNTLFQDAAKLEDDAGTATPGDGDLSELEKTLVEARVTYRIFTGNVSIHGAKWSRAQTQ